MDIDLRFLSLRVMEYCANYLSSLRYTTHRRKTLLLHLPPMKICMTPCSYFSILHFNYAVWTEFPLCTQEDRTKGRKHIWGYRKPLRLEIQNSEEQYWWWAVYHHSSIELNEKCDDVDVVSNIIILFP